MQNPKTILYGQHVSHEHGLTLNSNPKISVVLPVYNHAKYLRTAIDSVLTQKCLFDFELIIVNDGSTDKEVNEVLNQFEGTPNIKIIHRENGGISAALNSGFMASQGSFLTWTSADNLLLPKCLENLAAFLLANPCVTLVYGNVQLIDSNGKPLRNSQFRVENQLSTDNSILQLPIAGETLALRADNFVNACFMYRRKDALSAGLYNTKFRGYEDYDYWLRLRNFGQVAHLSCDKPYYQYRLHEESLTAELNNVALRDATVALVQAHKKIDALFDSRQEITIIHCDKSSKAAESLLSLLKNTPSDISLKENTNYEHLAISIGRELGKINCREVPIPSLRFSLLERLHEFSHAYVLNQVNENREYAGTYAILPPLKKTGILKRAIDGSFGGITPNAKSKYVALALCPNKPTSEFFATQITSILSNSPETTLALFCTTISERSLADEINTISKFNSNLRIIDATNEFTLSFDEGMLALLYALGSANFLLHIDPEYLPLTSALENRSAHYLASSAGLPTICFGERQTQNKELSSVKTDTEKTQNQLDHVLLTAPGFNYQTSDKFLYDNLFSKLDTPSLYTLEAWCKVQNSTSIASSFHRAICFLNNNPTLFA